MASKDYKFHYTIIEELIEDNHLKVFALYLKLKTYYKNSIFYNTSKSQLAKKAGISHYLLSRLLKIMIELD